MPKNWGTANLQTPGLGKLKTKNRNQGIIKEQKSVIAKKGFVLTGKFANNELIERIEACLLTSVNCMETLNKY